jgi:protein-S-isoprenylcysteine O-methyltransferase Ste14
MSENNNTLEIYKDRILNNPFELYGAVFAASLVLDFILGLMIKLSLFYFWTQFFAGMLIIITGGSLMYLTVRYLTIHGISPVQKDGDLLLKGNVYAFTRNPLYISLTIVYIGMAILMDVALAFLALPGLLYFISRYAVPDEEDRLHDAFGDDYQNYRGDVKRWF